MYRVHLISDHLVVMLGSNSVERLHHVAFMEARLVHMSLNVSITYLYLGLTTLRLGELHGGMRFGLGGWFLGFPDL